MINNLFLMLEKIIRKLSNKAAPYVLAFSSLLAGCTSYVPMNSDLERKLAQFPEPAIKKIRGESYDAFTKVLIDDECDYKEYMVSLSLNGKAVTEFHTVESKSDNKTGNWMILYPILGGDDLLLIDHIGQAVLSKYGINSVLVLRKDLLFPEKRFRPLKSQNSDDDSIENYAQEVVKDTARIVHYLENNGMHQFGFLGISYGGMQIVGTAPFFPESKINLVVMSGGDLPEILMNSTEEPVKKYKEFLLKEYRTEQSARQKISEINIEPLSSAKYIPTSKTRMIITSKDDVVPSRCQMLLYDALGKPTALFVPSNHYSLFFWYFPVRSFIVDEITNAFEKN